MFINELRFISLYTVSVALIYTISCMNLQYKQVSYNIFLKKDAGL